MEGRAQINLGLGSHLWLLVYCCCFRLMLLLVVKVHKIGAAGYFRERNLHLVTLSGSAHGFVLVLCTVVQTTEEALQILGYVGTEIIIIYEV